MTDFPITPPSLAIIKKWIVTNGLTVSIAEASAIASLASRLGADQELEACCEWVAVESIAAATELRAWRRPKPPSLKELALQAAQRFYANGHEDCNDEEIKDDFDTIRRALEQLDD
jgi:hypothetical protein